jgi:SAM-dependent methyltransferase
MFGLNVELYNLRAGNLYDTENFIKQIESAYSEGSFITVNNNMISGYNLTYGELTNDGIKKIIEYLKSKNFPLNFFYDLGCGNGKTLAYAVANGFNKAIGVEIVPERFKYGVKAIDKLDFKLKSKINLYQGDIFSLKSDFFPQDYTVIFVSNLLFPTDTNEKLLRFLSIRTSQNTILFISKIPDNLDSLGDFRLNDTFPVKMSWSIDSNLYVLTKKKI